MSSNRDFTKYSFAGQTMGKGRLVLALVKRYVADHQSITFDELRRAFPDGLQADNNRVQFDKVRCVVMRLADIPEAALVRFFRDEEDRMHLGDDVVLVSREWNVHNIQNVLARAEELGYHVATSNASSTRLDSPESTIPNTGMPEEPTLLFFRSRPEGWATSAYVASSLQSIESSFFLVALRRYPHALVVGVSAIESCLQAARIGAKGEKDGLQNLVQKAQKSAVINEFPNPLVERLRLTRNEITHRGFSPQDDVRSVSLYLEAVLPFLALCYREFHGFDLMAGLVEEYAEHLRAAQEVHRLAKNEHELDLSYCFHAFSHSIRLSFKESFSAGWEIDALLQLDAFGGKFERRLLEKEKLKKLFQVEWSFNCPVCHEIDGAVAEIDPDKMDVQEIVTKRLACPSCGFVVYGDQPYLSEVLLRRQILERKAAILEAYGA